MFECETCGEPCAIELFCGGVRVCLCSVCETEEGRSPVAIAEARALLLDDGEEAETDAEEPGQPEAARHLHA